MASIESVLRKAGWSEDHKIRYCRTAVAARPARFGEILNAIVHPDPYVRVAAAKAADVTSEDDPSVVDPFKNALIYKAAKVEQIEVRRHLIRVIARMELSEREYVDAAKLIGEYIHCYDPEITESCREAIDDFLERDYPESPLKTRFFTLLKEMRRRASPSGAEEDAPASVPASAREAPRRPAGADEDEGAPVVIVPDPEPSGTGSGA